MEESNNRPTPVGSGHFPGLDGLRALAVTAVFLFHGGLLSPELRAHAVRVVYHLDTGVQVFFVISGFLIYRPFAVAHLSGRPVSALRSYAVRRFLRIYPAYWVALGVLTILGTIKFPQGHVLAYVTLTQSYFSLAPFQGISVAWSLVIEVSFYVFVPLWAFAVRAVAKGRNRFAWELVGVGVVIALGLVALWAVRFHDPPAPLVVLPSALPVLGAGMLLAVLSARAQDEPRLESRLAWIGRPAGWWWLAAAGVFALQCWLPVDAPRATDGQLLREQLLRVPVALFLLVPAVLAPGSGGGVRRALAWRPVAFIGTVSYGMYLWHTFVGREVYGYEWIPQDLRVVLLYGATVVVASASWYLLERPVMSLARRRRSPVA